MWTRLFRGLLRSTTTGAAVLGDAELTKYNFSRAEAGEGGLDEICPNEHVQQQPPGTDKINQGSADENHGAGEDTNKGFSFHRGIKD